MLRAASSGLEVRPTTGEAALIRMSRRPPRCAHQVCTPCSFLLWILTYKRFHSNLAIAPTCDTVSTYHITDNARDPQRGLSRATYLLKVSRRAALPNEEES